MTVDEYFINQIYSLQYLQYFAPEIKKFINEVGIPENSQNNQIKEMVENMNKELPENFYELRKEGENDSYICKLIREDSIKDFISYFDKNDISCNAPIKPSIFETNQFLIKKKSIKIIEYAAFFGSNQIFKFLQSKEAKFKPTLLLEAIHGNNSEIIQFFEVENNLYKSLIKESIKCHHNEIANYFLNNYIQNEDDFPNDTFDQSLKYYNFSFIQSEYLNNSSFYQLCYYNYYSFVKALLECRYIDINVKVNISKLCSTMKFKYIIIL